MSAIAWLLLTTPSTPPSKLHKNPAGSACVPPSNLVPVHPSYCPPLTPCQLTAVLIGVTHWKEKPRTCHSPKKPTASLDTSSSVLEPLVLNSHSSIPDAVMADEPRSSMPPPLAARKHQLPTTPNKPKTSSSSKKKRVGSQ
jgi:hypothetical protein